MRNTRANSVNVRAKSVAAVFCLIALLLATPAVGQKSRRMAGSSDRARLTLLAMSEVGQESRRLDAPLGHEGTVSFAVKPGRTLRNGLGQKKDQLTVLSIPNLAEVRLSQTETNVAIVWDWADGVETLNFQMLLPDLPGDKTYFMQFTWEANLGLFEVYFNGLQMIDDGVRNDPWKIPAAAAEVVIPEGPATVSDLYTIPEYLPKHALLEKVPAEFAGRDADLLGQDRSKEPMDIDSRRGRLLLDSPLAAPDDVADWVMEGPGKIAFDDGAMKMWSTRPDAAKGVNGHIVHWCPRDFPQSFVAEWDTQILSDYGLNIVFFAAKGAGGEDLFDPSLPKRDGTFSHYTKGAITCYHVSYHANTPPAPGRSTSNLRKDKRFFLMSAGPVAIPATSREVHRIRLIKDGAHVQLQVDDKVSIDYTDPGTDRYGPVYTDGKFGLRQMQWTVARYRNLRIWELLP